VFARFFEQYVAYKTQSKNAYLCKPWDKYVNGLNKLAYLQEDEFKQILPVADKLVARIKDYVSGNGLPLKKVAYPIAIVYKPKDAPVPGTAATKQPQDTKATKNKTSIITAVRDPKTGKSKLIVTGQPRQTTLF
jgi:hypothetical protein